MSFQSSFRWVALAVLAVAFGAESSPASTAPSPGIAQASVSAKLHPTLLREVDLAKTPVKAWVFFGDKGLRSSGDYEAAIERVASGYNARAIQRRALRGTRAREGKPLFDFHDLPVVQAYIDEVQATGARVHVTSRWVNAVSVLATRDQLERIADLTCVTKLQPVARARRIKHLNVQDIGAGPFSTAGRGGSRAVDYGAATAQLEQINLVELHDLGYTGDGVVVGILDTGFRRDHVAFNNAAKPVNVIAEYDFVDNDSNAGMEVGDPSSQHDHGTMILGCLAAYQPGDLVGGAYDASFILCKTEDTTDEYPAEEDNYVAGLQFIEANGADMSTASLGYIDWYTQADLDGLTAVTTIAINLLTSHGVHHSNAAGNEYHDSNPATSSLIAPSDGFDVITCGAVNSVGTIASFSSDGPTADGRIKPELLARGVSTHTVSPSSTSTYTTADGTSLSTPVVACALACLIQAAPDWSVEEMRAHLFDTAGDYVANGTYDPLYVRGYGIVNAFAAYADCNLNEIADWCDVDCGTSGGECDIPGCGASADCNSNAVPDECESDCNENGTPDDCDIAACPGGEPLCQDCDSNGIPDECDAPFPQTGRVVLDRSSYSCDGSVVIQVDDCGLNADNQALDTVGVTIVSDSEPGGEAVTLTETGLATGTFVGSIPLSETDAAGVLLIGDGDSLTVTYTDADDGVGGVNVVLTDDALVDCVFPVISSVATSSVQPHGATVTFETDEPTIGTVRYGASCAALAQSVSESVPTTLHSIELSVLDEQFTYFYTVEAEDVAGNRATDDNGGACYAFTTPDGPDILLVDDDDNDPDVRSYYTAALTSLGYGYDLWDTANSDSEPDAATLAPYGLVIWFTGDEFGGTAGPGSAGESALGSFLDGGGCLFINGQDYFYDRGLTAFISGYLGVSSVSSDVDQTTVTGAGTFFTGFGPYTLSYPFSNYSDTVNPDATAEVAFVGNQGNAAVSKDSGTYHTTFWGFPFEAVAPAADRADLLQAVIDFCDLAGPTPPVAYGGNSGTSIYVPVAITLSASDDGTPGPLDFVITELPQHATLTDPAAGIISAVPYTLIGGGNQVEYAPYPCYGGSDLLRFKANDGGVAPDGGDSNVATVSIDVSAAASPPQLVYGFSMDADPGWSTQQDWEYGVPTSGGSHNGDPSGGYTGSNAYAYNLEGDYSSDMLTPAYLTTAPLDCTDMVETELRFHRWLGVEEFGYDHATLEVSTNGVDWTPLWQNGPTDINDAAWSLDTHDISSTADGAGAVMLRWGMGPTDDTVTYPGWNLDDIEIWARQLSGGDLNGDTVIDLFDYTIFEACYAGPAAALPTDCACADLDQDDDVDLADFAVLQSSYSGE
ncbi:MAG: S8 family serine peptidase [bacterium]|nr:S8 family serine peptidase [bacterium]